MIYIVLAVLAFGLFVGSSQVTSGIFIGILLFLASAFVYRQFPEFLKRAIISTRWIIDFCATGIVIGVLGASTATSLTGAVVYGILITLGMHSQVHILNDRSMFYEDAKALWESRRQL